MATIIRIATPADAPAIQAIYAPVVENTIISFETEPPTVEEMAGRIKKTLEFFPYLACEYRGEVIGYVYATKHRERAAYQWAVDVTAYIREDFRGKGVGKALYTALKGLLAGQGFYHAYAGIALPNPASVGLHESVGFKPLGVYHQVGYKLGGWHDVGWWELQIQPLELPPRPLLPFPEFIKTAGAEAALREGAALLRR